ncbi:MAG TPA: flagellar export protein FliJ [Polyangiaceae bacterium]|nr:flagellar export protein FliJ [Polyangiaceae bacterium]
MSQRKKRLKKLIELREHEVEQRLIRLAEQRAGEERAKQALMQQVELERSAAERRLSAISRAFDVNSLNQETDWLVTCGRRRELAEREMVRARRAVTDAQNQVLKAKNELKKIELLAERVEAEEKVRLERTEQRFSDELAALRFAEEKRKEEP